MLSQNSLLVLTVLLRLVQLYNTPISFICQYRFDKKIKGFAREDAILLGVESRTSSPIIIERDENKESNIKGIYPCGEGAGYAGGITSAAMDGIYVAEKIAAKRSESKERILSTRKIAMIGMFSAISAILMLFEFPMPFAPDFYKLDFSELPALIGTFAFGPVAGVMIEFCKILIKLLIKGTGTAFVGELANFAVGCSFILPAGIIYLFRKTKKMAVVSSVSWL